jgi:glutamate---cysteine ligase / carboxylate-amine ligase
VANTLDAVEHSCGSTAPFSLGVEEELLLVNAHSLTLEHHTSEVMGRVRAQAGEVKPDVYEALVESATPIVADAAAAAASLSGLRAALRDAGATLLGCGLHPTAAFGDVVHVPERRYLEIAESMQGLLRRTPTCALHVHVGMPDPDTAIAVHNRLRAYLPLLQALAAHSPYWHGVDSGFATARAQLFRGFPRAVVPPAFESWDAYLELIDYWRAAGDLPDYTFLWWDIRPHPQLGTVEMRAMDAQSRLDSAAGLAALVHALAAACADGAEEVPMPAEALGESSFRAGRDGLDATLWWRGTLRPVREIAVDALSLATPYARDLGDEDALEGIERILREGGGAQRMRAAHDAGGMEAVLALLAAEAAVPYDSTQTTSPSRTQSNIARA